MGLLEILEGVLRPKSGGAPRNPDILGEILRGGPGQQAPPSQGGQTTDIEQAARELEEKLHVGRDRDQPRQSPAPSPWSDEPREPTARRDQPPAPTPGGFRREPFQQPEADGSTSPDRELILAQAMLNAAKSDGEVSQAEEQAILQQLGGGSPEMLRFLREEFARPLDVRAFTWSVPLGLEQQVYSVSLLAMKLDSDREAAYLRDLAHGLRLSPEVCAQIHRRMGAPPLPRP